MCTITYIPDNEEKNGFVVTDNRDESINRPAEFPQLYHEYKTQLFYPKDKRAGGTWIGVSKTKRVMALMNGAFIQHKRRTSYRKSRGIVVKEILAADNFRNAIKEYDFKGIEPFFGVVFSWRTQMEVFELIWDGLEIYLNEKDASQPKIWSSAMTYSPEQHQKREAVFEEFLDQYKEVGVQPDSLWSFHHLKGDGKDEGLLINRGELRTTSVSQIVYLKDAPLYFRYEDVLTREEQQGEVIWK